MWKYHKCFDISIEMFKEEKYNMSYLDANE